MNNLFSVKKYSEYYSSTERYHQKKSETSASTADSGYPSTSRSTVSRWSIDASVSEGEISSGSPAVDETASHHHQNASDTLIAIDSALESSDRGLLASGMHSIFGPVFDLTDTATPSKFEDKTEHKPEEAVSQPATTHTNKRKIECDDDDENSHKKAKVDDSYVCPKCGSPFSRQAKLITHLQTPHWSCEICCKEFATEQKRSEHMKTHQCKE